MLFSIGIPVIVFFPPILFYLEISFLHNSLALLPFTWLWMDQKQTKKVFLKRIWYLKTLLSDCMYTYCTEHVVWLWDTSPFIIAVRIHFSLPLYYYLLLLLWPNGKPIRELGQKDYLYVSWDRGFPQITIQNNTFFPLFLLKIDSCTTKNKMHLTYFCILSMDLHVD